MPSSLYVKGNTIGTKSQNEVFFPTSIEAGTQAEKALDMIIEISINSQNYPDIQVTYDDGDTWTTLFEDVPVNTRLRLISALLTAEKMNFRCPEVEGVVLTRFVVLGDIAG